MHKNCARLIFTVLQNKNCESLIHNICFKKNGPKLISKNQNEDGLKVIIFF